MKTIEERAALNLIYEKDFCGNSLSDNMVCRAYVRGAEEQKAIDDAKLLKLKSAWEKEAQINHDAEMHYKQGYHDAIEKACEYLDIYFMEIGYPDDWMRDSPNMLSGEERFRKAMEESYDKDKSRM